MPATALAKIPAQPMERHRGAYYIRLMVVDQPGVIADVTATFRDEKISLESMLQRGRAPGETVPVILITHDTEESAMSRVLEKIAILEAVADPPRMIRIEGF